jgi:hypothetical protein
MPSKPKEKKRGPRKWALYRAQLSCTVGRMALEGDTKIPEGITRLEYAVFNLLHAVEEIAKALEIKDETDQQAR